MTAPTITYNPRRQYLTPEDAERDIEVYMPAGWCYEIATIPSSLPQLPTTYAIKVYSGDGPFLGYAYHPEEDNQ